MRRVWNVSNFKWFLGSRSTWPESAPGATTEAGGPESQGPLLCLRLGPTRRRKWSMISDHTPIMPCPSLYSTAKERDPPLRRCPSRLKKEVRMRMMGKMEMGADGWSARRDLITDGARWVEWRDGLWVTTEEMTLIAREWLGGWQWRGGGWNWCRDRYYWAGRC